MKLFYAPGACSLADRISLDEAGLASEFVRVDLKTKRTEDGADYRAVNPKGYVPALVLDDGETITENAAILSWIAEQAPGLAPTGPLGRIRLIETLAFISSEIHKPFEAFFHSDTSDGARTKAGELITKRYDILANALRGPFLFGAAFTVADAYLFVTLRWAKRFGVAIPARLTTFFDRVMARSTVRDALSAEGLSQPSDRAGETVPAEHVQ